MLENKKAVIFDLDGTLVDSMWIWREIDIRFLGKYGLEVPQGLNDKLEDIVFMKQQFILRNIFRCRLRSKRSWEHGIVWLPKSISMKFV